jgi:CheY-like chemotaxis protein
MTRILVIEDETSVRENIMDLLELEGYQTSGAVDGYEGYFLASTESFDLVVCDIMLPRLDGFEVLQRLRRDPRTMDLPLIFLTARTQREAQREGMNLGAEDYITKPYTRLELLQSIQSRLERQKGLDLALHRHWKDRQLDIANQMPLEFSGPLSMILNASGRLAHLPQDGSSPNSSEVGVQIHQSALFLMESVQKYLFLSDLELRPGEMRGQGVTNQTGNLLKEILADKAARFLIHHEGQMNFSTAIREDDFMKFAEYLVDFVTFTTDPLHPIEMVAGVDQKDGKGQITLGYRIPIAKSILPAADGTADRPTTVEREMKFVQRMAHLLGLTLDVQQREPQTMKITLRLPLANKDHGG